MNLEELSEKITPLCNSQGGILMKELYYNDERIDISFNASSESDECYLLKDSKPLSMTQLQRIIKTPKKDIEFLLYGKKVPEEKKKGVLIVPGDIYEAGVRVMTLFGYANALLREKKMKEVKKRGK